MKYVLLKTLHGHAEGLTSVKFSPNGDLLASVSSDKMLKFWDGRTGSYRKTVKGHSGGMSDVAWSPCGKLVTTASDDKTAKLWDVETGRCVATMAGHSDYVFCCNFDPLGHRVVTGSYDYTARTWDTLTGQCTRRYDHHLDIVTAANFSFDDQYIITGCMDGLCRIWDADTDRLAWTIPKLEDLRYPIEQDVSVSFATFSPNAQYALLACHDDTLYLWEYKQNKCVRHYTGHKNSKHCLIANFDIIGTRRWIVCGSEDNSVFVWDLQKKRVQQRLTGHSGIVVTTACHPTDNILATGALEEDNTIKLWKLQ